MKSKIQNPERMKQLIDFKGLGLDGGIYPTDIDGLIEYHDKEYIIIEVKHGNAKVPVGQRVAMQRMVDDFTKKQIYGVLQEDEVWTNLTPMPGAQKYLQKLHDEGHELYMVTATDYRTCCVKIERILELFPFLDANHIIIAHNKQMVRGDVLIDDGPHNLVNGQYFRILFDAPHNRGFNEKKYGMYRAVGWEQVYQLIHDNLVFKPDDNIWRNIPV